MSQVNEVAAEPDGALRFPEVTRCQIGGTWLLGEGSEAYDVVNPATEATLATVRAASRQQAHAAIRAARGSFDAGVWRDVDPARRSRLLHDLVDVLEQNRALLERQVVAEIGAPVGLAQGLQVGEALRCLRWFAHAAARGPLGGYEQGLALQDHPAMAASVLRREPVGVVVAITAYNYPLLLLARKLGPALAAGCSTVVLPSPRAPLTTHTFFEMAEQVGFPPGILNLVHGGQEVGEALTTDSRVDLVSFTGSVTVGRQILTQAAPRITRVVVELGGKSPNIVLPDADAAATVGPSIMRFSVNAGQGCGATTRILVPRSRYDDYCECAREFMQGIVIGDPADPRTHVGPLIRGEHRDRVRGYVERALEAGATVVAEGTHEQEAGFFMAPCLLGGVDNADEIAQHELFGPVGVLLPYDTVEEAIAIANATPFALNANVFGPTAAAMEVARALRSGTVTINGGGGMRHDVPWGGAGLSGLGREAGEEGFLEYFDVKHVQWPL